MKSIDKNYKIYKSVDKLRLKKYKKIDKMEIL